MQPSSMSPACSSHRFSDNCSTSNSTSYLSRSLRARQTVHRSTCRPCCKHNVLTAPKKEAADNSVRLSFKLPYHCHYGQSVCLLGKGVKFGNWETTAALRLKWSADDLWYVDVECTPENRSLLELEYKYIIKNSDGTVHRWKSGSNYVLTLQLNDPDGTVVKEVRITDAWDGATRELDVIKTSSSASSLSAAALIEPQENKLLTSMEAALQELEAAVLQAEQLKKIMADPAAPQMLAMDRKVAHLHLTVVALQKTLGGGQSIPLRPYKLVTERAAGLTNGTSALQHV